eukprot:3861891-Pyramimonas_sp.AAC.1
MRTTNGLTHSGMLVIVVVACSASGAGRGLPRGPEPRPPGGVDDAIRVPPRLPRQGDPLQPRQHGKRIR